MCIHIVSCIHFSKLRSLLSESSPTKKKTVPQSSAKTVLSRSLVVQDDSEEEEYEETKENIVEGDSVNIAKSTMIVKDSETSSTVVKNKDKVKGTKKAPKLHSTEEKREEKTDSKDTVQISTSAQKRISWAAGDPVPYMALVDAFDDISKVCSCMR